ncbi:SAFB-like transcription modulator isoform X2 [Plodia interpunctella]|uniref:SAFB-like transcription modulator isoform X2 n=1 Tax=Plodia interpunctella TaxID=58824 RepID=UPI00236828EA|nr:SAFB-like transcription modulator isoform X2 [Plodia interpunctella]
MILYLVIIFIQSAQSIVYMNVNFENKTEVYMYKMYVKVVCESRGRICQVSHKSVCAVRKRNNTLEYKDFENSCQVFMHNFCDQPGQEYYIVTTGKCDTYLQTRRNEDDHDNQEAEENKEDKTTDGNDEVTEENNQITEGNGQVNEGNDEVTEGNDQVTEGNEVTEVNDQVTEGNEVTEANDQVTEGNDDVTKGNIEVKEVNGEENDANAETTIAVEEYITDSVDSTKAYLRKATTKKAVAAKATTKKTAAPKATTKKAAAPKATTKKGATKKGATKKGTTTKKATTKTPKKRKLTKKDKSKFVPLYEVDTAFDDHICPLSCPDTYLPVCVSANRGNGMYFKFFTFVNHCSGDLYYCKNPDVF